MKNGDVHKFKNINKDSLNIQVLCLSINACTGWLLGPIVSLITFEKGLTDLETPAVEACIG